MSKRRRRSHLALAEAPVELAAARPPAPEAKPTIEARVGYDGQSQTQGHWEQEYHPDLKSWEPRIARYNEARTGDSSIVAALEKLWWPTARATWTSDAGGPGTTSQAAADLISANILRRGNPGDDVYRMRTPWRQFLWECFTAEQFGVSVHEVVIRTQPGPLGTLRVAHHLAWIHPSTIYQFRVDRDGALLGIVQRFQAKWWEGERKDDTEQSFFFDDFIPADNLFLHVRKQEGSNVEGTALLRGMYADAKRNQNFRNWQSIHAQRVAVGIPRVKISSEAPPQVQATAIDMAKAMRGGAQDRLYVVESPGVEVGFVDNESNAYDMSPLMRQGEDRLRGVASLEWAGLGLSGAGGARAVGDVQQRPFWLMCEGIAESIAEDIQTGIVEPLHRSNFGPSVPPPRLRVSDVAPLDVTAIATAAQAGLIIIRAEDENDMRRALKMRALTAEQIDEHEGLLGDARKAREAPKPGPAPEDGEPDVAPAKPAGKPATKKPPAAEEPDEDIEEAAAAPASPIVELAAKLPAKPRYVPRHASPTVIREAHDRIMTGVSQDVRPLREALVREAIAGAKIDGVRVTFGDLDTEPLREALTAHADRAREAGRELAREEIRKAVAALGVTETESLAARALRVVGLGSALPAFDPFKAPKAGGLLGTSRLVDEITQEMETVVSLDIDSIMRGVEDGIRRELLQLLSQGMDEDLAREAAQQAMLDRSTVPLDDLGREMASRGLNNGRAEVASQADDALGEAGLGIEKATRLHVGGDQPCDPCAELEGTEYDLGSDDYVKYMPPAFCEGSWRCHCVYEFEVGVKS